MPDALLAVAAGVLSLTDLLLITGAAIYVADRVVDIRGWSKSSKTLRRENEVLRDTNDALEETVRRHEAEIERQRGVIDVLSGKVAELEKLSQQAVLDALRGHEQSAARRHAENGDRHAEALAVMVDIRDALRSRA